MIQVATDREPQHGRTNAALVAGCLFLLSAAAAAAMAWTRLEANVDHPTLEETFRAIDQNSTWFNWHGTARIWFGLTLLVSQYFVGSAFATGRRWPSALVRSCFGLGGVAFIASGMLTMFLPSFIVPDQPIGAIDAEQLDHYRGLSGSIGNSFIGLALISLAPVQWRPGFLPKVIGVLGVVAGIGMLLVWWDAATIMHRVSGTGFLIWMVFTAVVLMTDGYGNTVINSDDAQHAREIT